MMKFFRDQTGSGCCRWAERLTPPLFFPIVIVPSADRGFREEPSEHDHGENPC
jgi:hypothetical protein